MTFQETFGRQSFWVIAETTDIKNYPDRNYCFLGLAEKNGSSVVAKIDAVVWSQHYHIIYNFEKATGMRFEKNMRLLLQVVIDYKPAWGLRLHVLQIDHQFTLGQLAMEKDLTLQKLVKENPNDIAAEEGIYSTTNKRLGQQLVMQRIALITAPDSDGQRDFLHELNSNQFGYQFWVDEYHSLMQGAQAATAMVTQLKKVLQSEKAYDAVVITRGGGGQLDFGPFDAYELGLAIARFPIPIITGIGHERNVSIADLMAHQQVKTPTKAADWLVQHNLAFETRILQLMERMKTAATQQINDGKNSLSQWQNNLSHAVDNFLNEQHYSLSELATKIKLLHPHNQLKRGYAMLKKGNTIITSIRQLKQEDSLTITLHDGSIATQIKNIDNETKTEL
jgi:exodeoxyribonuclease VII large subunit